jgi:hypothetical protein
MPEPEYGGIEIEEYEGGGYTLFISSAVLGKGNMKHRRARAQAIDQNMRWGRWCCWHCRQPVPVHKRADARFCGESCRKKAARLRRREG